MSEPNTPISVRVGRLLSESWSKLAPIAAQQDAPTAGRRRAGFNDKTWLGALDKRGQRRHAAELIKLLPYLSVSGGSRLEESSADGAMEVTVTHIQFKTATNNF
jgi:hypothetical protein